MPTRSEVKTLQDTVLSRYDQHARSLPRRLTDDPYEIRISETMLCQTQVSRVIWYYDCRLAHLPDIKQLAQADRKTLLQLWSWLWYNSRALRLQDCAQMIVSKYQGVVPDDYHTLKSLPGIWDYIASAVLAFAYHREVAVIDTNIRRVLIYRFDLPHTIHTKDLQNIARQTIPTGQAKLWRNAMMDYGAMVLTPQVTGIRPRYKQSPFEWSTRQVRSRIVKYLLDHPQISMEEIGKKRSWHDINSILNKMINESIITQQDWFIFLKTN